MDIDTIERYADKLVNLYGFICDRLLSFLNVYELFSHKFRNSSAQKLGCTSEMYVKAKSTTLADVSTKVIYRALQ